VLKKFSNWHCSKTAHLKNINSILKKLFTIFSNPIFLTKNFFMKKIALACFVLIALSSQAQNKPAATLRSILLEQLKTVHSVKDWFVPASIAVAGLTPEQANWKDGSGNHSIAQLTTHLIFWNKQSLDKFKGKKPDAFDGNNKETFAEVNAATWKTTTQKLDNVLSELETLVQNASEKDLSSWASTIAHIGTHNAYHLGQIIYIRKMKGWWNENNGVK
jgi:hypothetical protein